MNYKMTEDDTLEQKIQSRIKRLNTSSFMPADFQDLSDKYQVSRALRKLIAKNFIMKVGQGIYVRSKLSQATNLPIPEISLQEIALEVMDKLKIEVAPSPFDSAYKEKLSTHVPTGRAIYIKGRINRKIGFKGNYIHFVTVGK